MQLRKFGRLVDSTGNVELRKVVPLDFIKNLKLNMPNIQRNLNEDHVDSIVSVIHNNPDILNDNRILLGLFDSKYYIIDGQHRIAALEKLYQIYDDVKLNDIVISIKKCSSIEAISETYRQVNRNSPLDEFQKNLIENTTTDEQLIYNEFSKYMTTTYKNYLSKDKVEPRVPGINMDKTITILTKYRINNKTLLKHLDITNTRQLIDKMNSINDIVKNIFTKHIDSINLKNKLTACDNKYLKYKDTIDSKCKLGSKLYLGLPLNWMKLFIDINYPLVFPEYQSFDKKNVDKAVWNEFSPDKSYNLCYCCEDTNIQIDSCHMGHVLAKRYGGLYTIDNLRPICSTCNIRMGTENLNDYKDRLVKED